MIGSPKAMHRSISMPVKPPFIEEKKLQRSQEREILCEEEDYSSSSSLSISLPKTNGKNKIFISRNVSSDSELCEEKLFEKEPEPFWTGSTINIHESTYKTENDCREKVNFKYGRNNKQFTRLVEKNGNENVSIKKLPGRTWHYCRDLVTTIVEQDWKYTILMFLSSYVISWFGFSILWYLVMNAHGDLNFDEKTGERLGEGKQPCVVGVYDLTGLFIYIIETQTTIGFGEKYPSEECPEGVFLYMLHIICSIALEGAMISIVYAKTARPVKISKIKFSEKAVICLRDGQLCLVFRLCDSQEQQTIGTKVRAFILLDNTTTDTDIPKTYEELKLEGNTSNIMLWPETVCHKIDETSPFFYYNADDFNKNKFEIFISLIGGSKTTGQLTEAKTSYTANEIVWGQRFVNVIHYNKEKDCYIFDSKHFNTTVSVNMDEYYQKKYSSNIKRTRKLKKQKHIEFADDL